MTFSFDDLLTIKEILADALVNVGDEDYKMFAPGWYSRQVKSGLEKLNYKASFIEIFRDFKMPDNLILPLPSGAWNIKDIYLWNGDECVIEHSARVFHKDNFNTIGKEKGYTARKKPGQRDVFIPSTSYSNNWLLFYNTNMGNIMFSDMCSNFDNVRLVYNGMPKNIDDVKIVPPFCREALIGFVTERAFFAMKSRDVAYRPLWADAEGDLYRRKEGEPSKWMGAIKRIKRLDKKYFDDLSEYLSFLYY